MRGAVVAAFALLFAASAHASSETLMTEFRAYRAAFEASDFAAALPHAERAAALGREEFGSQHGKTAVLLVNLGTVQQRLGQLDEASRSLTAALVIWQSAGEANLDATEALWTRAEVYAAQGEESDARRDYARVIRQLSELVGPGDAQVVEAHLAAARFEVGARDPGLARAHLARIVAIQEAALAPEDLRIGDAYYQLAGLDADVKDYRAAAEHFSRAIAVWRMTLPSEHPRVLAGHEQLVTVYGVMGRVEEMDRHLAATLRGRSGDAALTVLYSVTPRYPDALDSDGVVALEFEISAGGHVENVVVLESSVTPILERAAVDALSSWRYRPQIVAGIPLPVAHKRIEFSFRTRSAASDDASVVVSSGGPQESAPAAPAVLGTPSGP